MESRIVAIFKELLISPKIKPLVVACISSCAAKKSARLAMPVVGIADVKSSADGPLVSAQLTLRLEPKSVTGNDIP
jgi:hypothetical protein